MRPIYLSDLEAVTRALCDVPPHKQAALADTIIHRASVADRYRKRLGRNHPQFGSGTLTSAIPDPSPSAGPACCDPLFLTVLQVITDRLRNRSYHRL